MLFGQKRKDQHGNLMMWQPLTGDDLPSWKKRLSLEKVMGGKHTGYDKRTTNGLKKIQRMVEAKDPDVHAFKNWLRLVEVAEQIMESNLGGLSNEELQKCIGLLQAEGVNWAPSVRVGLVKRRVSQLLQEKAYKQLLPIIDPMTQVELQPLQPMVAGLQDAMSSKFAFFQKVMVHEVMATLMQDGESAEPLLLELSLACADKYELVDFEELDTYEASTLDELISGWRCLQALLTTSINPSLKVPCSNKP